MKLSTVSSLIALGTVVIASGYQIGCSGASSTAGLPPPVPGSPTPASTNIETFAVKTLFLGEAARSGGAPSNSAWKSYGYNLDGKTTLKTSTDVCTLLNNAPKDNQVDGNNGIDNAFGSVILPIIITAAGLMTPSQTISQAIDAGHFTIMIQIKGFDDTPTQNSINLGGQLFAGGAYDPTGMTMPTFDMTTDWPVSPQLLVNNDPMMSQITFNSGYINNGTYVSGDLSKGGVTVSISLVFQGVPLSLTVHSAVVSFNHGATTVAADGTQTIAKDATKASYGTIAGVINTQELIDGLKSVAGRISQSLCGSAFMGIAGQIQQASDIIVDPSTGAVTNVAGQNCSGISIGLGFEAVQIKNPDTVANSDAGVPPDPCAMDGGMTMDSGGMDTGTMSDATGQ